MRMLDRIDNCTEVQEEFLSQRVVAPGESVGKWFEIPSPCRSLSNAIEYKALTSYLRNQAEVLH